MDVAERTADNTILFITRGQDLQVVFNSKKFYSIPKANMKQFSRDEVHIDGGWTTTQGPPVCEVFDFGS